MKRISVNLKYKDKCYQCSVSDWIHIKKKMLKLVFLRQYRRAKLLLLTDRIIIYLVILLMWALYILAVYFFGAINNTNASILGLLTQSRDNIFVTVIIAFSIDAFNRFREHTVNIKKQHYLYVDAMEEFEMLLWPLLGDYAPHYHPMYNSNCYKQTENYIKECAIPCITNDTQAIVISIYDRLHSIERELKSERLIVDDEEMLCLYIGEAKSKINRFMSNPNEDLYWSIVFELYNIQNELKYPWRIDEKDNKEIIQLLYKDNKEKIESDFYLRMQLDNFCFAMLDNQIKKLEDEIQVLKEFYKKGMLKFKNEN